LGYFLGEQWSAVSGKVHGYLLIGVGALAAAAGLLYFVWRRRRGPRQ
jgi:membrane protein DedA with SNARE-associated domain